MTLCIPGYTNKAILPTTLEVSNGDPQEDKSTHISTTNCKVSYHLDSVHNHDGVLCTPGVYVYTLTNILLK